MLEAFNAVKLNFFVLEVAYDQEGNAVDVIYREVNSATEELTGKSRNQLIGKSRRELYGEVYDEFPSKFDSVLKSGKSVHFRSFGAALNKYYDVYAWKLTQKEVAVLLTDITESEKAQEELKRSHRRNSDIINSITDYIYAIDRNWNFIFVNDTSAKDIGYKSSQLIGKNIWKWVPKLSGTSLEKEFRLAMENRTIRRFEWKTLYTEGYREFIVYPSAEGITVYGKNITERKKAEDALKESEERFAKAFRDSPTAMSIGRLPDGALVDVNDSFLRLSGYSQKEEVINRSALDLGLIKSDSNQKSRVTRILSDKALLNHEINIFTRTGKTMTVLFSAVIVNLNGKNHVISQFVDITERKRAEEALKERTEQLEQTQERLEEKATEVEEYASQMEHLADQRAKQLKEAERLAAIGATAGMVGHDIRNPLQSIESDVYLTKMEIDALPDSDSKKSVQENLQEIEENIFYIDKIVMDLQDYAKPLKPTIERINLHDAISKVLTPFFIPLTIQVDISIDEKFPILKTNESALRRILNNLILNAVQAMPHGGKLTITAKCDRGSARISVSDTGVGIPDSLKPQLFKPLVTTKSKGQGFGLAVVKKLTEDLGMGLAFETEVNKGTTFSICIPSDFCLQDVP